MFETELPKLLVVDDKKENLVVLEKLLSPLKIQIFSTNSGNNALSLMLEHKFLLVILDTHIPSMNGHEVLEVMSWNEKTRDIPVIFIAPDYTDDPSTLKNYQYGNVDYLYKPINDVILLRKVKVFLDLYEKRTQLEQLRKTVEEQLTNLALYDHLTKLPNRLLFEKTMSQTLARARRNNKLMALMFLDLDHFKDINDRLGHDIGDLLLKGVSNRLIACIRETDTVARLGGDEFAIILDEISATEDAAIIAEKIIETIAPPFSLNANEVFVSASIGIAVYPISGETSISLTKNADIAMYQAKQTGRDQYCFFTDIMNEQIRFRLEMVHSLRYSIDRNELELYYQPKLDLGNNLITGTEALLRWNHPVLGLLKPIDFIQVAEETGLIQKIGKWTIEEACRTNKHWQDLGLQPSSVAVNLSSFQIAQDDIIEIIKDALEQSGLQPKYFEIELTETSLIANTEKSAKVLHNLHEIGVGITIDDFGIGYSSLYYLKKLPVDTLKIDQSFVCDIPNDSNDTAIVKAVIALAHNLELSVIAEGVEQPEQLQFLRDNFCDQIQGFLFSNPLPAHEMEDFFRNYKTKKL